MLGIEKSVRAMYGEGYDEETLRKYSGSGTGLAAFALFLAAVAIVIAVGMYFRDSGGTLRKAMDAATAAQTKVRALEARLAVLEAKNGSVQDLLVAGMVSDIKQKAAFLAAQPLSPAQKAALAEALAPLAPPAPPAPAAAPAPAAESPAKPAPAPVAAPPAKPAS